MTASAPTPGQWRIIWLALIVLSVSVMLGVAALVCWGLATLVDLLSPVLWPLAVAAVVACLLSPVVNFVQKRGVPRARAIILVFVVGIAIGAGALASVIPQMVVETQELARKIPNYTVRLEQWASHLISEPPEFLRRFLPAPSPAGEDGANPTATTQALDSVVTWLGQHGSAFGTWLFKQTDKVAGFLGIIVGLALVPVFAFYFLLEQGHIEKHWREYLPVKNAAVKREVIFVLESINLYLVAFFRGQVLVAICDAFLYTLGFWIAGLNYVFLVGFAAVFLTMIPFLGAIILCVATLLLTVAQFGDWLHPVIVLGIFAVVQTLEALFISPKIIGDRVGLHPMVIIIAVMTGTTVLGGILGGILAIPLAAALRVILARYVWKVRTEPPA